MKLYAKLHQFHWLESRAMYRGTEHVNFHLNKAIIAENILKMITLIVEELK